LKLYLNVYHLVGLFKQEIAEILRTASEDIGLINRVIKFHIAQRMWSALTNVTDGRTDGQTPYDGNTAPLL